MSTAIQAKSAKARATIARNLLIRTRRGLLSRSFDNCFEMGDADQVLQLLIERVPLDEEFRAAVFNYRDSVPQTLLAAAQQLGRPNEDNIWQQQLNRARTKLALSKNSMAR